MFASTPILVILFLWTQVTPSHGFLPNGGTISFPMIGKLNLGNLGKAALSFKTMAEALQQSDIILVVIKGLEILRNFIGIIAFPSSENLDAFLEMLHGLLESAHAIFKSVKENVQLLKNEELAQGNEWIFAEKPEDKTVWAEGMTFLTSITKQFQ